ncbi:hypothetical protein PI125_g8242 [Phytophthora idaei]|nr:hypothetical protein PI125_g8242 [Phytophthora idaei]
MVHLTHSALHWRLRCINDTSSDDENTPPNVRSSKQEDTGGTISDIGTATPRSLTPAQSKPRPKTAPDYFIASASGDPATISTASKNKQDASSSPRRASCSPRVCCTVLTPATATSLAAAASLTTAASLPSDGFVPARWPWRVAHLHEQYNPLVTIFLTVKPFGWCTCSNPCRVESCRNSLMHVFCNVSSCPYGVHVVTVWLSRTRSIWRGTCARTLAVVATEDIDAGVVLGQYLGEIEHVSASRSDRPRNTGHRLVLNQ